MSPRGWEERVQDILDAISEIQAFVASTRFEEFQGDLKTMRAVEQVSQGNMPSSCRQLFQ
jgi:uncharacterized protein with HEPN domain